MDASDMSTGLKVLGCGSMLRGIMAVFVIGFVTCVLLMGCGWGANRFLANRD